MHALAILELLQICCDYGKRNATEGVPYSR